MDKKQFAWIMAALGSLVFPLEASAYLDPGTGSYFFQVLIAAFVSSLFLLKRQFKNIMAYLAGLFSGKKNSDGE